ncbi:hypothetical protein Tco_0185410 [Tanacetum coccineum]
MNDLTISIRSYDLDLAKTKTIPGGIAILTALVLVVGEENLLIESEIEELDDVTMNEDVEANVILEPVKINTPRPTLYLHNQTLGGTTYWEPNVDKPYLPLEGKRFDTIKECVEFYSVYVEKGGFEVKKSVQKKTKSGMVKSKLYGYTNKVIWIMFRGKYDITKFVAKNNHSNCIQKRYSINNETKKEPLSEKKWFVVRASTMRLGVTKAHNLYFKMKVELRHMDNVKMLLEESELTKEDRESQLYDDFEHLRQNKGETIHDYYVWFAKLINDMRNIKMTMSKIQHFKLDQLYDLPGNKHEAHANENKMMLERLTQQTVDPLALMSNVSPQHYHSQSSTNPPTTYHQPHSADTSQSDLGLSPTENLIENLTNTLALLTQSYKTFLPQTNNQLRTSSNTRNQAIVQDGKVVVQNV